MELELKHLDAFFDVYENGKIVNDIPDDKLITVYIKGSDDEGFIDNVYRKDLGIEIFIVKKWQYQKVVDELVS